jgi:CRP/FNR family cyclic AMP-dependent transcriptional regulator
VLEQDWGESLFVLRGGMAKVRCYTADGNEVVMSVLGEGDVFGEMAAPFAALLEKDAGFALARAHLEASRLRDLNQHFAIQSGDATTRLLDALAYLARCSSAANDPQALIPALAQGELGLLAGLARETASRTLSKLRSRGTVEEVEGGLRIRDLQPLIKRGLLPA